jgi:Ca2+-binding EF-hand superfamily protein
MEEIQQILGVLQEVSNGRLEITQKKFEEVLSRLEAKGFSSLKNTALQSRMFELFDADGNRSLDARELIAGLSLVCKGTPEERLKLTFDLYDADGSGTLNRAELFQGLKSAHEHAVALQNKETGKTESRRNAISKIRDAVDDIMRAFDVDGNSTIDFDEFKSWGMRSPFINITNDDDGYLTMGELKGKSALKGLESLNVKIVSGEAFSKEKDCKFVCSFLCSKVLGAEGHVISAEERKELQGKVQSPPFSGVAVGSLPPLSIAIDEGESDGLFVEVISTSESGEVSFSFFRCPPPLP